MPIPFEFGRRWEKLVSYFGLFSPFYRLQAWFFQLFLSKKAKTICCHYYFLVLLISSSLGFSNVGEKLMHFHNEKLFLIFSPEKCLRCCREQVFHFWWAFCYFQTTTMSIHGKAFCVVDVLWNFPKALNGRLSMPNCHSMPPLEFPNPPAFCCNVASQILRRSQHVQNLKCLERIQNEHWQAHVLWQNRNDAGREKVKCCKNSKIIANNDKCQQNTKYLGNFEFWFEVQIAKMVHVLLIICIFGWVHLSCNSVSKHVIELEARNPSIDGKHTHCIEHPWSPHHHPQMSWQKVKSLHKFRGFMNLSSFQFLVGIGTTIISSYKQFQISETWCAWMVLWWKNQQGQEHLQHNFIENIKMPESLQFEASQKHHLLEKKWSTELAAKVSHWCKKNVLLCFLSSQGNLFPQNRNSFQFDCVANFWANKWEIMSIRFIVIASRIGIALTIDGSIQDSITLDSETFVNAAFQATISSFSRLRMHFWKAIKWQAFVQATNAFGMRIISHMQKHHIGRLTIEQLNMRLKLWMIEKATVTEVGMKMHSKAH